MSRRPGHLRSGTLCLALWEDLACYTRARTARGCAGETGRLMIWNIGLLADRSAVTDQRLMRTGSACTGSKPHVHPLRISRALCVAATQTPFLSRITSSPSNGSGRRKVAQSDRFGRLCLLHQRIFRRVPAWCLLIHHSADNRQRPSLHSKFIWGMHASIPLFPCRIEWTHPQHISPEPTGSTSYKRSMTASSDRHDTATMISCEPSLGGIHPVNMTVYPLRGS